MSTSICHIHDRAYVYLPSKRGWVCPECLCDERDALILETGDKSLWMILVPNEWADGKVPMEMHKEWDKAVEKIAKGLTVFHPTKGRWICPNNIPFEEEMIPVAIYCTDREINQIADMTAKHYNQHAIMFYEVSNNVHIKNFSKNESND